MPFHTLINAALTLSFFKVLFVGLGVALTIGEWRDLH